jgi:hypothetical protein|tara:strand:- start:3639 stop:3821 length:183 start_codon:yes stop_codon:yes gene_type:complete
MGAVQNKYWSMESNAIADHMMQAIDAITDLMSVPADPDPEQDPDDWREANEQDKADEAAS